jgi:hypothetical protein
MMKSR